MATPAAHFIAVWPWPLIFWPRGQCRMCTKFGVDSSSRFSFRERTHTNTRTREGMHRCHWSPNRHIRYRGRV